MTLFVGIDVSSQFLDVALGRTSTVERFKNDDDGREAIAKKLLSLKVEKIVMESSGGYERQLLYLLSDKKLPVALVNPRQVRDFAKASGVLAKTDKLDAKVLAHFAEAMEPEAKPLPTEEERTLEALLARRQQVVEMIVSEKNREPLAHKQIKEKIKTTIKFLETMLKEVEKDLDDIIDSNPVWKRKEEALQEIAGIGKIIARSILILIPDLGKVDRKKIAAISGVAPQSYESGKMKGKRRMQGGRSEVKAKLFMGAMSAVQHNEVLKKWYEDALDRGKPKMVALGACMRKLIVMANWKLKALELEAA